MSIREVVGPHAVEHFLKPLDALRGAPLQLKDDGDIQLCQLEAPEKSCLEFPNKKNGKIENVTRYPLPVGKSACHDRR